MNDIAAADLLIRVGVGIVMVAFGINQIASPVNWLKYIPRLVRFIMPIDSRVFMRLHGTGNVTLGLFLASGLLQPLSIWTALLWWLWILPFAAYYDRTIGLRDFAIIVSLAALLVLN